MNSQVHHELKSRDKLCHDTDVPHHRDTLHAVVRRPPCDVLTTGEPADCCVSPHLRWYIPVKAVLDVVLGFVLLVLTGPITLLAALLVKLTSRGPAFYCQVRLGKDGKPYTLYKLRTMNDKAEALTGPVWSDKDDARITPLGRLLRKTHVDEFPQLVNVVCGQMSLIGPRPERPEIVAKLDWEIPCYRERLKVRPGITGLAQVRLPPDTDLESVRRKVVHDVYYVRNVSPALDLKLLMVTGWDFLRELMRCSWERVALPNAETIEQGFLQAVTAEEFADRDADSLAISVHK